jgi:hypothetical protein
MWRTCQGLIPLPDINNELNFTDEFGDRLEKCYSGAVYDTPRDVVGRWVPDRFGEPIVIGGVSIRTGDYLMADRDGALIIPHEIVAEVTDKVEEVLRTENQVRTAILQGVDPVDAYLKYSKF